MIIVNRWKKRGKSHKGQENHVRVYISTLDPRGGSRGSDRGMRGGRGGGGSRGNSRGK